MNTVFFRYNISTVFFTVTIMTRKEGVFSFTVYCDQPYLEKVKFSAKENNQKISAFVLSILDQHFGDTVTNTVPNVLTDILTRLELVENEVFSNVTDTVISTVTDTVTDTDELPIIDTSAAVTDEPKVKYSRDELEKLKNTDIRKTYRAEIPVADRALNPNYAPKADLIDAIINAQPLTP